MYAQYVDSGSSSLILTVISLASLAVLALWVVVPVQILRRAGYSGWWVLVLLVPVVNLAMVLRFAFTEWPVQRALREATGHGYAAD